MNLVFRRSLALAAITVAFHCAGQVVPYDLAHPDRRFRLPEELKEVSALTDISATTVACLQDEAGTIYWLDHLSGAITMRIPFAGPGDYEGLTRIGQELYALRSDGLVHRLKRQGDRLVQLDTFRVRVPNHNLESLGHDPEQQVLLIAAKDILKGDKASRDRRFIYGWDLRQGKQMEQPVLTLSVNEVLAEARRMGVVLPQVEKHGRVRPDFKLRPSSVAVHPQDGNYWILSAKDHALLVVDRSGKLQALVFLDPVLFPKAEGITFMENGDLLVSSEGAEGGGWLLFFHAR
jgi:uncharacterized protein YjiK